MKDNNTIYYGYKVPHQGYTDITRERNEEDEWSGEDTSTSWTVEPILTPTDTYPDVTAPFEVIPSETYYLVYYTYNTGDSFSHDIGKDLVFVDLFKTKEKAEALLSLIENKEDDGNYSNYSLVYKNEIDEDISFYCPWLGYFESLDTSEILSTTLTPEAKRKYKNYI